MKYIGLFSLKNNEKVFINVVRCSHDWRFKGKNPSFRSGDRVQYCESNVST